MKEDKSMKYAKAMVTIIDLGEEEILTESGCTTSGFQIEDNCTGGNHQGKISNCKSNGHKNHGGQ